MTDRIGIRELRQHASRYVDRVAAGERFEVTNRGRLVAMLVPVEHDPLARLEASGQLRRATREVVDLPDAAPPKTGHPTATDALLADREDER